MDGHRNCLVIDDDKIALKLAATCCHELGLKVYIADTPAEAFDELKRRRYRLIVVDHHVHGVAGFEILDQLRVPVTPGNDCCIHRRYVRSNQSAV